MITLTVTFGNGRGFSKRFKTYKRLMIWALRYFSQFVSKDDLR